MATLHLGHRAALLRLEEEWIQQTCRSIIEFKPDLVITEKGLSDLAMHYLTKAGVSAIRRLRKTDNNRIARACGATIVNRVDEVRGCDAVVHTKALCVERCSPAVLQTQIKESDIGTKAGLFEVQKIGDEFYSFITECREPKACTILLRGASKDVLNEIERNLHDAMGVARNVMLDPRLLPGA